MKKIVPVFLLVIGCGEVEETLFSGSASSSASGGGASSASANSTPASTGAGGALPIAVSSSSSSGGFYWKSGVQHNVLAADMTGWVECYSGLYADLASEQQILSGCAGSKLAMACREKGSATLALVAMGDAPDVGFQFGKDDNTSVHQANGVGWYRAGNGWGFLPGGETRDGTCDATGISPSVPGPDGDKRVCWAAGSGNLIVGYRCGFDCGTNYPGFDYKFERVVLSAP